MIIYLNFKSRFALYNPLYYSLLNTYFGYSNDIELDLEFRILYVESIFLCYKDKPYKHYFGDSRDLEKKSEFFRSNFNLKAKVFYRKDKFMIPMHERSIYNGNNGENIDVIREVDSDDGGYSATIHRQINVENTIIDLNKLHFI